MEPYHMKHQHQEIANHSEKKVAISRRAERSMVRVTSSVKLVDKRNTEELIDMLGLKKAADKLARANGMRWYGHVLS